MTTLTDAARKAALKTKAGRTITGEEIRQRVLKEVSGAIPPSAWGGVIQGLVRSGLLSNTGDTTKMESPQARGRRSPVYIRNPATTRYSA